MTETTGVLRKNIPVALRVASPALLAILLLSLVGIVFAAVDTSTQRPWFQFILIAILTLVVTTALTAVRCWVRTAWLPVIPFVVTLAGFALGSSSVVAWSVVGIVVAIALHGQYVEKTSARD